MNRGVAVSDKTCTMLDQVRECFGKVSWSHKTHECQASIYFTYHNILLWCRIILSALAAGSGVVTLLRASTASVVTAVSSTLVLVIDLVFKDHSFADRAVAHQATATRLWRIRESYFTLIAELLSDNKTEDDSQLREKIENLADELQDVYLSAPRTTQTAYIQASKKLKGGECCCTDEEVDGLLPPGLRKSHA